MTVACPVLQAPSVRPARLHGLVAFRCCALSGLVPYRRLVPRALPWAFMLLPPWGEQRSHTSDLGEQRSHTSNLGELRSHTSDLGEQRSHTSNLGDLRSHANNKNEPRIHTRCKSYARRIPIASNLVGTPRASQAVGILLSEYFDRHSESTLGVRTPVPGAEKYLL